MNRYVCDLKDIVFDRDHYDLIFGSWGPFNYSRTKKELMRSLRKFHKVLSGPLSGVLLLKETVRDEDDPVKFLIE